MEKKMSRRDLIKTLIAGSGGIVAAGFVPEKWLKPVVKSGVLPVHAQASAPEPTASPEPTPQPTQTPDYIQGGYEDYYPEFDYLIAFAFVSSQPIPEFNTDNNDFSSVKGAGIENPVEGKDVTLFVDGVKESTKKTNELGYVEWQLPWNLQQPLAIDPTKETLLRFEMVDGSDEVLYVGWDYSPPA